MEIVERIIKDNLSLVREEGIRQVEAAIRDTIARKVEGDFMECGVWRGGLCILAKQLYNELQADKKVFVADSFTGVPPPKHEKDSGDRHHLDIGLAISSSEVKSYFEKYGLLDDKVVFIEGRFCDSLPTAPVEKLSILRLDGDMYESTMDSLVYMYPKLQKGGYLIIDDYLWHLPCKEAVDEYLGEDAKRLIGLNPSDGRNEIFYLIK